MMKRVSVVLALLLAGCSSAPENAGESVENVPVDDTLKPWIAQFLQDKDVLDVLNRVDLAGTAKFDDVVEACGDAALLDAWKARQGAPILDTKQEVDHAIAILQNIPNTGSKYVPQNLERIVELAQNYTDSAVSNFAWTEADRDTLAQNLQKRGYSPQTMTYEVACDQIVAALKGDDCNAILGRYCTWVSDKQKADASRASVQGELNARMACDLVGWARALRLDYPQNDYTFDVFRQYMSDQSIADIRVKHFVEELAKSGPDKAFARISPPDEQYEKLIAARKIYLDAIEAGGWPKVENVPNKLVAQVGKAYAWAPGLKQRLIAEGYTVGDPESDIFDEQTRAGVELYREMHQLNTKNLVDQTLIKNMAVPPETRLENIDLTIQRYREAAVGSLPYYVKVNVPDFYGEVWKDGQRIRRFKIVAGNNKVEKDPETNKIVPDENLYPLHPNRTPLQTSKINEVIYLPYWNVPARIRQQELEPKLAENPNYYAENNYEEVNVGDPKLYYVRELPNPKNSLGKVKMMFPNPHNTYLHDTPAKAAFNNPTRALSHGCMRVQDPLELAKLLLVNDGQWDERKVNAILNADPPVEEHIYLNHPVDVDVVYLNNRVDDTGVVAFLSDVYEYDAVRLGRVKLQKLPRPKDWPRK